ncbi:baseplate multidomain protein megatron [Palleronia rufa]|uniref:baseplate multidomain protein megatron n=1 Tax=Palleronia rufa TaxID=1530186 RepID=UPI0005667833|nr:glycoside hydrolase/phage tail family protein [Palleronia rufa]
MATILLSAVGGAVGASLGGGVLGLSSVVIGRAVGATLGRVVDQAVMGAGSQVVEQGRLDRLRLTSAGEGQPVPQVFGRFRIPAHVLWSSPFREEVSRTGGGGKGAPSQPTVDEYSYSISLALGLCEGEIARVGRIWADGEEIERDSLDLRVYPGDERQLPDPLIAAVMGAENAPGYRGLAYVVLENLGLGRFGNRVPQFSFEVIRNSDGGRGRDMADHVRAVAMIPGTGEYSLATTPVRVETGLGESEYTNVHGKVANTDLLSSLDALTGELPRCRATSLVVSWFGNDLRCGTCTVEPKVEYAERDGVEMPWRAGGITRSEACEVARLEGRPVYGGTPSDQSVLESIRALKEARQAVMFYPFVLMDQLAGNGLPDPYGDVEQARLPWRGRITGRVAPGRAGTSDRTAAADAEVAAFFGTAQTGDFSVGFERQPAGVAAVAGDTGSSRAAGRFTQGPTEPQVTIRYTGDPAWSYRRFILHYAHLCAAAGGVDSFCIGSEMVGLTQLRGADGFPAVEALRVLAQDVRAILGPDTKIGYAADWTEYFGYQPPDAPGDLIYHLDPLWSDPLIDFVGIDNYMPLSDWRDTPGEADAAWGGVHDLSYLKSNILGGEGYDWFYADRDARDRQIRTPITDGSWNEPWIWRVKDIRSWWRQSHHNRIDGVRDRVPTGWIAGMKPIWFTEIGCAAVDKGTNQPNKFLDPKSSESSLPYYSTGRADPLIQVQYIRAMYEFWEDPANNPVSDIYGGPMVDMGRAHVWAWDGRPYPEFPGLPDVWSDSANHDRGHWLTGRSAHRRLASIVAEVCRAAGLTPRDIDADALTQMVRGYTIPTLGDGRSALQPLMLAYGFDAVERGGRLVFRPRGIGGDVPIDPSLVVENAEQSGDVVRMRMPEAELAGRVSLGFVEDGADFAATTAEAIFPDERSHALSRTELPLVLTRAEGREIAERWLVESRVARDRVRLGLPPSRLSVGAGDVIDLDARSYRIDRVEQGAFQQIEAVRIEAAAHGKYVLDAAPRPMTQRRAAVPPLPVFLDLPLLAGDEIPHAPHVAATSRPWSGPVAVFSSPEDAGYGLDTVLKRAAVIGTTQTPMVRAPSGRIDRGPGLRVRLVSGVLSSVGEAALRSGANAMAIGSGLDDLWEVFQFATAELVGERTWLLGGRLRGQAGTDGVMPEVWPAGSRVVLIDGALSQVDHGTANLGVSRHYRIGPASRPLDSGTFLHGERAFDGIGLRPYRPVHLRARQAAGGLDVMWVRRTRIGGDSWTGLDVPLGEDTEAYLVTVSTEGRVLREVPVFAPAWRYGDAARAADAGAGPVTIGVAQLSARFGPGPAATLTL